MNCVPQAMQTAQHHVLSSQRCSFPESVRVGVPATANGIAFFPSGFEIAEQHMAIPPPRGAGVAIIAFLFGSPIKRKGPHRPPAPKFPFRRTEFANALRFTSGQTARRLSKHVLSSRKAGSLS